MPCDLAAVVLIALCAVVVDPIGSATADTAEAPAGSPRGAAAVLTAGGSHSCALLDNGAVKCWGENSSGQLGLGNTNDRGDDPDEMGDQLPAVDLGTARTATAITAGVAVGGRHTCALLDNGTVKCWGANGSGQLGLEDNLTRGDGAGEMGDQLPAIDLGTGRTATAITAGDFHTCALLDNGTTKCWGANDSGQLGLGLDDNRGDDPGEMGDQLPAIDLGTGRRAVAITAGAGYTCALVDNSTVKCWGRNDIGQLGLGDVDFRGDDPGEMGALLAAVELGAERSAAAITADFAHTCALLDNGTVKCWGENSGILGQEDSHDRGDGPGEMGDQLPPIDLDQARTTTAVTAGASHTCALLDNGTVKCWGSNFAGQLGQGHVEARGDHVGDMGANLDPVDLAGLVAPSVAAPAAPTGVTAIPGNGQAVVSWTAPADNGGAAIIGYRVQSSTDNTIWTTTIANTATTATSTTVTGLSNGVPIRFRVAAINTAGTSPPSLPSGSIVPIVPIVPGPITPGPITPGPITPGPITPAPVFSVIEPVRVLDTRHSLGTQSSNAAPVPAGTSIAVHVTALPQVPDTAVAVVVNVTTTRSAEAGFVTIHPCHLPVPEASNLNYRAGFDTATLTIAPVSSDGKICAYTSATTDLIADITAYTTTTNYQPATPTRLADTRDTKPQTGGTSVHVALPHGAHDGAHVVSVTATRATAAGYLTAYDCAKPQPDTSVVNYIPGVDTANLTILTGTELCVYTSADVDIIVDHNGTIDGATNTAQRLIDTRTTGSPLAPGQTLEIPPTSAGTTRAINVTATQQTAAGFFTLHPCNAPPTTSNLNYAPGRDIANLAIIPATATCITTSATTHLIIDLAATIN